jgi:hypothetical protein
VLVHQSTTYDRGSRAPRAGGGDYGGATPDPAANLSAAHGEVWLTNQYTKGGSFFGSGDATWNWEAKP